MNDELTPPKPLPLLTPAAVGAQVVISDWVYVSNGEQLVAMFPASQAAAEDLNSEAAAATTRSPPTI